MGGVCLTFSQVMNSKSNLGEVARPDHPSQLVKADPASEGAVVHGPLWMGQVVAGLLEGRVRQGLQLFSSVLLGLQLLGGEGEDIVPTGRLPCEDGP